MVPPIARQKKKRGLAQLLVHAPRAGLGAEAKTEKERSGGSGPGQEKNKGKQPARAEAKWGAWASTPSEREMVGAAWAGSAEEKRCGPGKKREQAKEREAKADRLGLDQKKR